MITALQLIDDLRDALNSVDTDKLNVHIKSTDVSAGDASAANQTTMITALQILDNLVGALNSVGTDKLDIHLLSSALTIGDATAAKQDTIITALQLIDDLRGALGSVNTDDLQVDIKTIPTTTVQSLDGDKIFSFNSMLTEQIEDLNLDNGNNTLSEPAVPAGVIWVVTNVMLYYSGTPPTRMYARVERILGDEYFAREDTVVSGTYYPFNVGHIFLREGERLEMRIIGATNGDDARMRFSGYKMAI